MPLAMIQFAFNSKAQTSAADFIIIWSKGWRARIGAFQLTNRDAKAISSDTNATNQDTNATNMMTKGSRNRSHNIWNATLCSMLCARIRILIGSTWLHFAILTSTFVFKYTWTLAQDQLHLTGLRSRKIISAFWTMCALDLRHLYYFVDSE